MAATVIRHVVCYDVVEDKKRAALVKLLEGRGRRVEKSVFECDLTASQLQKLIADMAKHLDPARDCCHIYRVCGECARERILIGKEQEPELQDAVIC